LSVDQNVLVTARQAGNAIIQATLAQNETITANMAITAVDQSKEPYVKVTGFSDASISQYNTAIYTAAYFENGLQTDQEIEWSFGGASEVDYTAEINGNSVTISCDSASDVPLIVTASCNGYSASVSISLEGY